MSYNFGHMPPKRCKKTTLDVLQGVGALALDMEGGARYGSEEGRQLLRVAAGGLDGALVAGSLPGSDRTRRHRRRRGRLPESRATAAVALVALGRLADTSKEGEPVLARVVAGAEPNTSTVVGTTATTAEASARAFLSCFACFF